MEKIKQKEKEITTLKVKYDRVKKLLESHGFKVRKILRDTSVTIDNGSSHRVLGWDT